ncbi:sulfotransferase domain-containing protein [Yoonia algicola]|uniref:Sulfotransferase domain-containing protein n=1 Tax=Yoonia algicola TaxID=3137368 RepID=A0AAN0M5X6_9RHOB
MNFFPKIFRLQNPDIVISFPKSGRTWLRVMLDEIGTDLEYTHAGSGHRAGRLSSDLSTSIAPDYKRIVFLHRDPRDTAVSGYYHKQFRLDGYDGTISDFIRDPCFGIHKIMAFNKMWQDLSKLQPNMYFITYENLQENTAEELMGVLDFLKYRSDPDLVTQVVERNTFDNMRKREAAGDFAKSYGNALVPKDNTNENSFKVRRGKVAGYHEELTPHDIAWCQAEIDAFNSL